MVHEKNKLSTGNRPENVIIARMDKIAFPEICPVCLDQAEDLVPVSIYEKESEDERYLTVRSEGSDQIAPILAQRQGAVTFWIPTCEIHGSKSVATTKKKVISIVGFMILFYPLLFYVLGLNASLRFDRPIFPALIPLLGILVLILVLLAYGFFPRALERNLKFIDIDRTTKRFSVLIKNDAYRKKLLEENEMNASLATEIAEDSRERE